jgi:hypothetical protein
VFYHIVHFTRRVAWLAAVLVPLASAGGCALMNQDLWNPDHYRDPRAVDIDHRLDKPVPTAKNPF